MNRDDHVESRIRASFRQEGQIADDGFAERVLAGIAAPARPQPPFRSAQLGALVAIPVVILLLALTGWMPTAVIETWLTALLLTGLGALVWIGTASGLPSAHVLHRQAPH